jgi:hypothetical protein
VAELISLGKVKTTGMIESEMDYRAANPFTTHNLSLFYLLMMLLQLRTLFKKYCFEYLPLGP